MRVFLIIHVILILALIALTAVIADASEAIIVNGSKKYCTRLSDNFTDSCFLAGFSEDYCTTEAITLYNACSSRLDGKKS